MFIRTLCLACLVTAGCSESNPPEPSDPLVPVDTQTDTSTHADLAPYMVGPQVMCDVPYEGFDRLVEQGADRGLRSIDPTVSPDAPCVDFPGAIVATDVDADGAPDLLLGNPRGFPFSYRNDGTGHFEWVEIDIDLPLGVPEQWLGLSAVDLNGDDLPEIAIAGEGHVLVATNLGAWTFGPWEIIFQQTDYPRSCLHTMAWGDIDGDGDLDVLLPGLDRLDDMSSSVSPEGVSDGPATDWLVYQDAGTFEDARPLSLVDDAIFSLLGVFTDRDADGDLDVFVVGDREHPSAFYRNDGIGGDGEVLLADDASSIGADLRISGMGIDVADIDHDGDLDYCIADASHQLRCLFREDDQYFDVGEAIGLSTDLGPYADDPAELEQLNNVWWGWSVEILDLDNDGWDDVATTAGSQSALVEMRPVQPDAIWQGVSDGTFVERSLDLGFSSAGEHHYGMAAADFEGDGYRDLVMMPYEGVPRYWSNPCGSNHWLDIEPVGPPENRASYGARIELEVDGRLWMDEVQNMRTAGQSSASVHFGLGSYEQVDRVTVHWLDGTTVVAEELPTRTTVRVFHPDALRAPKP